MSLAFLFIYTVGSGSPGLGSSGSLWYQKASKDGSALHGWLCYSLSLGIDRKNCTEAWACLGLNQLRYEYPYYVALLLGLWAVLSC
jgi:hypothetical protein